MVKPVAHVPCVPIIFLTFYLEFTAQFSQCSTGNNYSHFQLVLKNG